MSRRLVFFDCETTGVDPYQDRIVELAIHVSGMHPVTTRINPGRPIPPEASAVHGITDEDVSDAPRFEEIAADVQRTIEGCVLVGYNCIRFDTILLDAELRRAGQSGCIDFPEIDLYQVWQRSEPRTLTGAVKRFLGRDLDDAHSAAADASVLRELLASVAHAFGIYGPDMMDVLQKLSKPPEMVDRDGKFIRREDGVICFNIGNKRGEPASSDEGFLRWMLGKDFSPETKAIAKKLLRGEEVAA